MEKKVVVALTMILLIITANMETVKSQVDYDACNTACVGLETRLYLRCEKMSDPVRSSA